MITVVAGYAGTCAVCLRRADTWWRGADFYACVHEKCAPVLAEWCPTLTGRAPAVTETSVVRRGAYARRAGGSVAAPLFVPARFPGYTRHDAWLALAETSIGHVSVPCGANAGHGVATVRRWEKLTGTGHVITITGASAVGAALFDPDGVAVMSWGWAVDPARPWFEPLQRVAEWGLCPGCGMYMWPGRWVTVEKMCRLCTGDADGRPWPHESDFPGEEFIPDDMRDDVPRGRRKRVPKEFSRAEHD